MEERFKSGKDAEAVETFLKKHSSDCMWFLRRNIGTVASYQSLKIAGVGVNVNSCLVRGFHPDASFF